MANEDHAREPPISALAREGADLSVEKPAAGNAFERWKRRVADWAQRVENELGAQGRSKQAAAFHSVIQLYGNDTHELARERLREALAVLDLDPPDLL